MAFDLKLISELFDNQNDCFGYQGVISGIDKSKRLWSITQGVALSIFVGSTTAAALAAGMSASPVLLGGGLIGMTAATVYIIYAQVKKNQSTVWKSMISKLLNGDYEGCYKEYLKFLEPQAIDKVKFWSEKEFPYYFLKKEVYQSFEYNGGPGNHHLMLYSTLSSSLLICLLHRVKQCKSKQDLALELQHQKPYLELIEFYDSGRRGGNCQCQKEAMKLLLSSVETIWKEIQKLQIPQKFVLQPYVYDMI